MSQRIRSCALARTLPSAMAIITASTKPHPGHHPVLAADAVPLEAKPVINAGVQGLQGVAPPPRCRTVRRRREDAPLRILETRPQRPPEVARGHARQLSARSQRRADGGWRTCHHYVAPSLARTHRSQTGHFYLLLTSPNHLVCACQQRLLASALDAAIAYRETSRGFHHYRS